MKIEFTATNLQRLEPKPNTEIIYSKIDESEKPKRSSKLQKMVELQ